MSFDSKIEYFHGLRAFGTMKLGLRLKLYSSHRSSVGTRLVTLWRCVCMKTLERQLWHFNAER
jgi:hypothetical protein